MREFRPPRKRVEVSVDEPVHIQRELQELTRHQLFELAGISITAISAIENESAEQAKAFIHDIKCHCAVFAFPCCGISLGAAA